MLLMAVVKPICLFFLFQVSCAFRLQLALPFSRLVLRSTPGGSVDSSGLPIDAIMPDIIRTLDESSALVLEAPPGAGKVDVDKFIIL